MSSRTLTEDEDRKLMFCRRVKNMSAAYQLTLNNIFLSDEYHIYSKGMPNRQNYLNWSSTKLNVFLEKL